MRSGQPAKPGRVRYGIPLGTGVVLRFLARHPRTVCRVVRTGRTRRETQAPPGDLPPLPSMGRSDEAGRRRAGHGTRALLSNPALSWIREIELDRLAYPPSLAPP